jgi:polar amino acid transport system substrate-binding protein
MGSGRKWWLRCGLLLCLSSSSALLAQCPAQIRLPYNSSWLPYIEVTEEGVTGTDIELIRKVLKDLGSELQLLSMPESRALNDLEIGKVDLLFGASYTAERAKFAWFSKPYRYETSVVIVHPQVLQRFPEVITKTAFLELARRKLIGTFNPKGFYGAEFEQLKLQQPVQQRSVPIFAAEQRMALVLNQRADFTVTDQVSMELRLDAQPVYQQLVVLPFELNRADIHLMLSKKTINTACVELINTSLSKIKIR